MKRLAVFALALAVSFLFVWLDDPFGRPAERADPPELQEAPPQPGDADAAAGSSAQDPLSQEQLVDSPEEAPVITGRVNDLTGRAVPGARIGLFPPSPEEPAGHTLYDLLLRVVPPPGALVSAVSDDNGRFTLHPPGPGRYRVITEARRFARDVLDNVVLTREAPGGELDVVVEAGTELTGTLADREGRRIPGGVILIRSEGSAIAPAVELTTTTDALGRFDFPSLPAGRRWDLLARGNGLVRSGLIGVALPQTGLDVLLYRGQDYRFEVRKAGLLEPIQARVLVREGEMPVAAGETDEQGVFRFRGRPDQAVTIHLLPENYTPSIVTRTLLGGSSDLGVLFLEVGRPLVGVVVDRATRQGIGGAEVCVNPLDHVGALPPRWLTSDPHGVFTVPGYAGRGLALAAFREGYTSGSEQDEVIVEGWPTADVPVPLARTGVVRGRVWGPRGQGAREANVRVVLADGLAEGSVLSGDDGGFELRGVPAGRPFRVVAWQKGLGYAVSGARRLAFSEPTETVDLHLNGERTLGGHVVDALGKGVVGARVWVQTDEKAPLVVADTFTGPGGRFALDGLAAGPVRVGASHAGYLPASVVQKDEAGFYPPVEITLRSTEALHGVVYFRGGRPAAQVVIRVRAQGTDAYTGWGYTDLDGRFTVAGMGAGPVEVRAERPGGGTATTHAVNGQGNTVSLILRKSGDAPDRPEGKPR